METLGGQRSNDHEAGHSIKGVRNELTRLYMANGWYEEAAELTRDALEGLPVDRTCPNREAVVRQALGRALVEAGELDEGQAELERAADLSAAFLDLIERGAALSGSGEGTRP